MTEFKIFEQTLTMPERRIMARLTTPSKIQDFLDRLPYNARSNYRCPLRVFRERIAHCFDGALFAAAMLRRLGYPPLVLNMFPNDRDDDHMLAMYKCNGHWGAVAKSNFVGLRYREPIYRTLREMVMSYFEQFYNVEHEKTLRSYSVPLNLKAFDKLNWMTNDEPLERIGQRVDKIRKVHILTRRMIAGLSLIDERSYQAGLLGANEAGLYRPQISKGRQRGLRYAFMVTMREEQLEDTRQIQGVHQQAFGQTEEADIVNKLRQACTQRISLVAVSGEQIVGHILFTPVTIQAEERIIEGMGLAPMAVLPEFQRQGIGSRLVNAGVDIIKKAKYPFIVVLGHPTYYPRFGFVPASHYGIRSEYESVPDEAFMILAFDQAALKGISGVAKYRPEFSSAI